MGWFVHYWDEIDKRNVCSDASSEQQGAMLKAWTFVAPHIGDLARWESTKTLLC
jgi:hypothetical protein